MQPIELTEGQTRLRNAAKYLDKRWKSTSIRSADINDKLACDKLLWLIHNYHEPQDIESPPMAIPSSENKWNSSVPFGTDGVVGFQVSLVTKTSDGIDIDQYAQLEAEYATKVSSTI